MNLPSGTVTFLFTDIEGSTRLWEQSPEAMRRALARHDALAAAILAESQGAQVKGRGEGDSLFAVFGRATDAVAAACALQQAFAGEAWPEEANLRVRMALHTGEADLRDGDYYGPAVNRCARLRAAAHGEQILLSQATGDLVRDALPAGCRLKDLGQHRLKDLLEPTHVWQASCPPLPDDFPPLQSLNARQQNLPIQLTSFIGREREMADTRRLLSASRLLTLTGTGGLGKTRLALQVAADALESYLDGVWLVELASLSDPLLVPQEVASVLQVKESAGTPLTQALAEHLRAKELLLLLDNCEHLLSAAANLADALLRACPRLRILATSREPLGIPGETLYRVPALSLPEPQHLPAPETLGQYEAIRLFLDRAAAATPTFAVTARNAPAVSQVCRHLDGIPLAIELAAARVKSLPVEQIAERLADRFRLLTGGSRTALPRQQTLRALFDWSYDLLDRREQELFHRISVFVGGFTLEAAEAVCADASEYASVTDGAAIALDWYDILDLLSHLVDRSLLIAEEQDGRVRYRLLETLRQYAREKLDSSGIGEVIRARHRDHYLIFAEESERKLRGSEQSWWMERLDAEHDNLRAALGWSPPGEEADAGGLRMAGALWWFWHVRGFFAEGREWLGAKLANSAAPTTERARALNGAAVLARNQGDFAAARALSEESLAIKRELGDRQGIAASLNNLATLALSQGDYAAARPYYEESLGIERLLGNRQGITSSLIGLGNVALEQGEYAAACRLYEEALAIKRELGDRRGIAASLTGLGNVALAQNDLDRARSLHEEALTTRRQQRDRRNIATSLQQLGSIAIASGEFAAAESLLEESLAIRRELGDKLGIANAFYGLGNLALAHAQHESARTLFADCLTLYGELENRRGAACTLLALAFIAVQEGQAERAAQLFGAAEAIREAIQSPLHPNERAEYDRYHAETRALLGAATFDAAFSAGRSRPLPEAIQYALVGHLHCPPK